jgi:hypothetical protein
VAQRHFRRSCECRRQVCGRCWWVVNGVGAGVEDAGGGPRRVGDVQRSSPACQQHRSSRIAPLCPTFAHLPQNTKTYILRLRPSSPHPLSPTLCADSGTETTTPCSTRCHPRRTWVGLSVLLSLNVSPRFCELLRGGVSGPVGGEDGFWLKSEGKRVRCQRKKRAS